jgi:phosphoribosylanthranilate isomerase
MFTIKICGITRPVDALAAAAAGADAIGLNFYAKSVRAIDVKRAAEIIAALPEGILKVGVFVNAPAEEVCRTFDELGLDLIQLHGDEPPEYLAKLGKRPMMKAFRAAGVHDLQALLLYVATCRELCCLPRLVLLDSSTASGFGGSGKLGDWTRAKLYLSLSADLPPLVLAGGLRPENVAEGIRATGVHSVDTASGVESKPGIKDAAAIAAFVVAAKRAFSIEARRASEAD